MKNTTLCYLEYDDQYLMLYRNKKKDDYNGGKWIGVGGKQEPGETIEDCLIREVFEETGIKLNNFHFYGAIGFRADTFEDEDMYLYSSKDYEMPEGYIAGDNSLLPPCNEGELKWIPKSDVMKLPMWEGDKAFLQKMLNGEEHISMTLKYVGDQCTIIED